MKEIVSFHNNLREQKNILVTVDKVHAKIEEGKAYHAHINSPTLADTETIEMYFKAPASPLECHSVVTFGGELGGFGEIREGATVTLSGSVVTIFNRNRNSTNTSTAAVRSSPTVTASGTQLAHFHVGGGFQGRDGGNIGDRFEWPLKFGTIYIFRYTSIAGSNEADIALDFYTEP